MIKNDFKAYAAGSNKGFSISKTLPEKIIIREREIKIENYQKKPLKFLSAVCGEFFTLYLVTAEKGTRKELVYSHSKHSQLTPPFLNINGHNRLNFLVAATHLLSLIHKICTIIFIQTFF